MSQRSNISGPNPKAIALMQEYRTRLTADIVTGKLDVREAAAELPAEPEESTVAGAIDDDGVDPETPDLAAAES